MTTRPSITRLATSHASLALFGAMLVAGAGLYPHLRWSVENDRVAWFFNSYDEGYYGWLGTQSFSLARLLADTVMHGLYWLVGADTQRAMIVADGLLPFGVMLAACYLVRPLFTHASTMLASALFVTFSAECLVLRSTLVPYAGWRDWLMANVVPLGGGASGLFQFDNPTATFWLFRTPEPQATWIILFVTLGLTLRLVLLPAQRAPAPAWFIGACVLAGCGYLFCALPLGGALMLYGFLAARRSLGSAKLVGFGGLVCVTTCMGLSLLFARKAGGDSLSFPSHAPVVMLSAGWGLLATLITALRAVRRGAVEPADWLAIALGLTPLCLANQQLVTGRMIYLLNFENYGLAQVGALACLVALRPGANGEIRRLGWVIPSVLIAAIGWIVWRSQLSSYEQYKETNRVAMAYAQTLRALPVSTEPILCDDFLETDILPLLVGRRPPFLLARDTIFTSAISRLQSPADLPANGAAPRTALFQYLAVTGATPADLQRRLNAITDPGDPNWQDRFMLGAFLYNHADFWQPLTHGRDTRLNWIAAQRARVVAEYAAFLGHRESWPRSVIFIMRDGKPGSPFLQAHSAQVLAITPTAAPYATRVYRLEFARAP